MLKRRKLGVRLVSMFLMVAMLFALAPAGVAAQAIDVVGSVDDAFIPGMIPAVQLGNAVGRVTEMPLSVEIIKNTRELAIVKVNDILITQELDTKRSTREKARAILRIEDLNSGEVEEIQIVTSYRAGKYTTTLYREGRALNTFQTQYDPLKPSVLQKELNKTSGTMMLPQNEVQNRVLSSSPRTFRWDDVPFICGRTPNINYSRPDVSRFPTLCTYKTMHIRGDRLNHIQISQHTTNHVMSLPPAVAGAVIGAAIASLMKPGLGSVLGGVIGAGLVVFTGNEIMHRLVDDRGNIWTFVHRCWTFTLPVDGPLYRPKYLRLGDWTLWDHCQFTSWSPHPS